MTDRLKGFRVEPKPIRGLLKVELFDAKTKKLVQKAEKENMVTNAIKNMLQGYAATNQMANIMPLYSVGLGGIMLFDAELEASADNIHFPMSSHLVGYGTQEVNTTNTLMGSKNSLESSVTLGAGGGSTTVWDFGTSQANGTIAAVALTSASSPFKPLSRGCVATPCYYSGSDRKRYNQNAVLAYEDGYAYIVRSISSSVEQSGTSYTRTYTMAIHKTYAPMHDYKVGDSATNNMYTADELHQTLTWTQSTTGTCPDINEVFAPCVDIDGDGSAYIIWSPGNATGNGTLYVTEIERNGLEWTANSTEVLSLTGCPLKNNYGKIIQGSYLVMSYDGHSFYKIDSANPQDIKQITLPDGYYIHGYNVWQSPAKGGGLYFPVSINRTVGEKTTTYYRYAILYPDGTIVLDGKDLTSLDYRVSTSNTKFGTTLSLDDGYAFGWHEEYYSPELYGFYMSNYLGTIANLKTPIVKNASQTLKITYSLVDA